MHKLALIGMMSLAMSSMNAFADEHPCPPGGPCEVPVKETCFNVVCEFSNEHAPEGMQNCRAAAVFNKNVTTTGGEVADDSTASNNPTFEVTCNGVPLFNNSAHRYTDLLGTRIQGETGPHPAISLPRGALHTGPNGSAGYHVSPSRLEIDSVDGHAYSSGKCSIWTGAP